MQLVNCTETFFCCCFSMYLIAFYPGQIWTLLLLWYSSPHPRSGQALPSAGMGGYFFWQKLHHQIRPSSRVDCEKSPKQSPNTKPANWGDTRLSVIKFTCLRKTACIENRRLSTLHILYRMKKLLTEVKQYLKTVIAFSTNVPNQSITMLPGWFPALRTWEKVI